MNNDLTDIFRRRVYVVETGILLNPGDPEFENYAAFDPAYGFYDENAYYVTNLDRALAEVLECIDESCDRTYAVVYESQRNFGSMTDDEIENLAVKPVIGDSNPDVLYSIVKIDGYCIPQFIGAKFAFPLENLKQVEDACRYCTEEGIGFCVPEVDGKRNYIVTVDDKVLGLKPEIVNWLLSKGVFQKFEELLEIRRNNAAIDSSIEALRVWVALSELLHCPQLTLAEAQQIEEILQGHNCTVPGGRV